MALPAYLEQGKGDTTVFLLHGVGGGKEAWACNQPVLAGQGFRTIAWDMPGYGASLPLASCSNAALAEALQTLIEHVGAKRNVLLGHSMGGMLAQELAALHPALVHGLVLYSTSPAFGKADGAWQQQFLQSRFAPLDQGLGMAGLAHQLVPTMFAPDAEPARIAEAAALMARVPADSYRAALSTIVSFNRLAALADIAVPTLCLAGELDQNAPPAVVKKMAGRIAGADYVCLPGVGHIANIEQPDSFNGTVLTFLKQHFPI
ncbi:alpha/beta fold hydrolase [Polaromonas sp.]|uniref:alpha/beta fold hydrolase n=1 Tax=Polaromonas sp. TaxID=1869339 RepID=UPI0032656D1A